MKPEPLVIGSTRVGAPESVPSRVRLADLLTLLKPRIGVYVVLAAFTGGWLAGGPAALAEIASAALLVGAVASASCAFNQILERDLDGLMHRTRQRPLPSGRLGVREALIVSTLLTVVGTVGLAVFHGLLAALLALSTLLAYVLVYTPLKRHSTFNTVVGAIPGAMPPLLGYVAVAGVPGPWAWMLFAVIFAWQFPHFLAIAWLHREDYRRAGMRMLPAIDRSEGMAGRQALLYSLVLLPVAQLPAVRGDAGWVYAAGALALGLGYVLASARFALREERRTARAVLLTSLLYLPLLFLTTLADPIVRSHLHS